MKRLKMLIDIVIYSPTTIICKYLFIDIYRKFASMRIVSTAQGGLTPAALI